MGNLTKFSQQLNKNNGPTPSDTESKFKARKTSIQRLRYAQSTPYVQMPRNTYSRHPRAYKSISFHIPIHRPFLTLKNNKRFLNQNQIKTIINSINETPTSFIFGCILTPFHILTNIYLFKVNYRKATTRCERRPPKSIWCLYCLSRTSHLTLPFTQAICC